MKESKLEALKRYFAQTGSARKAAAFAGLSRMTGRRWLIREGLIKEGDDEE